MKIILKKPLWFKVITTLCLVVTLFAATGCDKSNNDEDKYEKFEIKHVKTELGGCNVERGNSDIEGDTVIITISENSVNVFVGFTYTCKVEPFKTQVEIIDDVLCVYINDICYNDDGNEVDCGYERCYCYYTFDFVFNYEGELNQKYKILTFLNIRPDWEEMPRIISEGIINTKNN